MKLCKDCDHVRIALSQKLVGNWFMARCAFEAPDPRINPISGASKVSLPGCEYERDSQHGNCGPEARNFKPITFWRRLT